MPEGILRHQIRQVAQERLKRTGLVVIENPILSPGKLSGHQPVLGAAQTGEMDVLCGTGLGWFPDNLHLMTLAKGKVEAGVKYVRRKVSVRFAGTRAKQPERSECAVARVDLGSKRTSVYTERDA